MNAQTVEQILTIISDKLGQPAEVIITEMIKSYATEIIGTFFISTIVMAGLLTISYTAFQKAKESETWSNLLTCLYVFTPLWFIFWVCMTNDFFAFIGSPKGYVIAEILSKLR